MAGFKNFAVGVLCLSASAWWLTTLYLVNSVSYNNQEMLAKIGWLLWSLGGRG